MQQVSRQRGWDRVAQLVGFIVHGKEADRHSVVFHRVADVGALVNAFEVMSPHIETLLHHECGLLVDFFEFLQIRFGCFVDVQFT